MFGHGTEKTITYKTLLCLIGWHKSSGGTRPLIVQLIFEHLQSSQGHRLSEKS